TGEGSPPTCATRTRSRRSSSTSASACSSTAPKGDGGPAVSSTRPIAVSLDDVVESGDASVRPVRSGDLPRSAPRADVTTAGQAVGLQREDGGDRAFVRGLGGRLGSGGLGRPSRRLAFGFPAGVVVGFPAGVVVGLPAAVVPAFRAVGGLGPAGAGIGRRAGAGPGRIEIARLVGDDDPVASVGGGRLDLGLA